MTTLRDIVVVTPTYNEKDNLPILAAGILAHPGFRMLVVDDGSPDGTGAIAEDLARQHPGRVEVMHRKGPRGLGRSYIDGLRRALESGADLIFQMDADLSHNPEYLPAMAAAAERYDVVIGSRYLTGVSVVNWPLHRIFLSAFANRYVRAVTRISVADCTSGFRCWRRDAVETLPLDRILSNGYAFQVELTWEAAAAGCRIVEVPITFVDRREGSSKMSTRVLLESAVMPWRLAMRGSAR
jgi:dolichol-phosphate mannosyltransferase